MSIRTKVEQYLGDGDGQGTAEGSDGIGDSQMHVRMVEVAGRVLGRVPRKGYDAA